MSQNSQVISEGYTAHNPGAPSLRTRHAIQPVNEKAPPRGRYRRDLTPQDRSERQRLQLLSAAARAFAEKGFANTAVEDVVKAAGMSRATFYIHFQDKDELLGELYDTGANALIRAIRSAVQDIREPLKRLEKAFDTYVFMLTHGGCVARVIVNEVAAGGPKMLERRDRVHSEFIEMFRKLGSDVIPLQKPKNAQAAQISDVTLRAMIAGIEGVVFNYLWRGESEKLMTDAKPYLFRFMLNSLALS